ncbi:MAG: threonine/serine exporter family protein [Firmicutes bacterium]|nr:threonine/serine exporter family protein [Bacillota bacterium]
MTHLLIQFVLALLATGGFSVIFRIPVRRIPFCALVGAFGWITEEIAVYYYSSPVFGCFIGACTVGLLSTLASRTLKDASTIFVIPGILCLVPGLKIFNTMYALLKGDIAEAAQIGTETLLMAGAIALGLLTIGAILRVFFALARKTVTLRDKF